MSDKEKWKTFPCKTCLIKGVCKDRCFIWPDYDTMGKHVEKNQLKDICVSCGFYKATYCIGVIQWTCKNCWSDNVR